MIRPTVWCGWLALVVASCGGTTTVAPPPQVSPVATATTPPLLPDSPPVTDGDVTATTVNGMQILVKRTPGTELAAMQLFIRGGASDWKEADAGISALTLAVATLGGSSKLDKVMLSGRLAGMGSTLGSVSLPDYSVIAGKAVVARWDETFELLVDSFVRPALPAAELELQRQHQLATLRGEQENPDLATAILLHHTLYAGHPFQYRPVGTERSVSQVTLKMLGEHLSKMRETGRLLFVAVGDLDDAHVIAQVRTAFGSLPRGNYRERRFAPIKFAAPSLLVVERQLPSNYVQACASGPEWMSSEFVAGMVAMNVLHGYLFGELRSKRSLAYTPSASLQGGQSVPMSCWYVTTPDPAAALPLVYQQIQRLRNAAADRAELRRVTAMFLTTYLSAIETSDGQAGLLAAAQLMGGDWKLGRSLPERVRAVKPADVRAFAQRYLKRFQVVALGDPARLERRLFNEESP